MKKKRHFPEPPQLVSRKKRDFFYALKKNPNLLREAMEISKASQEIINAGESIKNLPAITIDEWIEKAYSILPVNYSSEENLDLLKNFVKTLKDSDTNDSCNEREGSNN